MTEVVGIAVCGTALIIIIKSVRPELGFLLSTLVCTICLFAALPFIHRILGEMEDLSRIAGLGSDTFMPIVKAVGLCFIFETASELCRDAGENALGSKVELFGKVLICSLALPIISTLSAQIVSVMP